jgi:hypothetical protein
MIMSSGRLMLMPASVMVLACVPCVPRGRAFHHEDHEELRRELLPRTTS